MWHLRARDLHPGLSRFLSADPVQPNAPATQGYNLYAYVANNPTNRVDPSGYSVAPTSSNDDRVLSLLFAMGSGGGGLVQILQCALDERCRDAQEWLALLGSQGANAMVWNAAALQQVFATYPQPTTPVDPGLLALSIGLSNTPIRGDLYDLYTGLSGYDPLTGRYLMEWERLVHFIGVIPIPGVSGSNVRQGVHAMDSLIDEGDDVARFIGAACSFDAETPVATFSHVDATIVELTIDGETLKTTADHPFYVVDSALWLAVGETQGRWTPAGDLKAGDQILQAGGTTGIVQAR